jgi:hypothetical protein
MENIAETGQLHEAERQIEIVRTDPLEKSEPVEAVQLEAPSDLDEPEGTLETPGVTPAPADRKIEPARDQMKAGYGYAWGRSHGRSAQG